MNNFIIKFLKLDGSMIEMLAKTLVCYLKDGAEISILANHHPLIAVISKGYIKVKVNDKEDKIYLNNDCLLEFKNNEAKILELF